MGWDTGSASIEAIYLVRLTSYYLDIGSRSSFMGAFGTDILDAGLLIHLRLGRSSGSINFKTTSTATLGFRHSFGSYVGMLSSSGSVNCNPKRSFVNGSAVHCAVAHKGRANPRTRRISKPASRRRPNQHLDFEVSRPRGWFNLVQSPLDTAIGFRPDILTLRLQVLDLARSAPPNEFKVNAGAEATLTHFREWAACGKQSPRRLPLRFLWATTSGSPCVR